MSMLAFFPWLNIEKEIKARDIKLVPFNSTNTIEISNDLFSSACELLLRPYVGRNSQPLKSATIMFLEKNQPLTDFNEEERSYLFSVAELVAFSALSKRQYFRMDHYWNRSNFNLVIQTFQELSNGVSGVYRRRDGSGNRYINKEVFQEKVPGWVNCDLIDIDITLFDSLLNAQENLNSQWISYFDAIFNFNHANTDEEQFPEQQETVMLIGAFQRILDCSSSQEDELIKEFMQVLKPASDLCSEKSNRIKGSKYQDQNKTLREVWLRDFYQLRGDFAHGKRASRKQLIWKSHEHLLLGSYIFPLIVKIKLSNEGLYSLTKDDCFDINVFEILLDEELFKESQNEWPWNKIRSYEKIRKIYS